jgi:hypothetical protein
MTSIIISARPGGPAGRARTHLLSQNELVTKAENTRAATDI